MREPGVSHSTDSQRVSQWLEEKGQIEGKHWVSCDGETFYERENWPNLDVEQKHIDTTRAMQ